MRRPVVALLVIVAALAVPAPVQAGPEEYKSSAVEAAALPPFTGPSLANMTHLGNVDGKEGTDNSDMAFWGDLVFAGNYNGFRVVSAANPARPQVLVDYFCRGPQSDLSVYRAAGRLLLFQSVDQPQDNESCDGTQAGSSRDMAPMATYGFEGIRIFDVTDPRAPRFVDAVPTACGSHTHTLVPDDRRQRLHLYVSSYAAGLSSPSSAGPACLNTHRKISIVTVPFADPSAWTLGEEVLSQDTAPVRNTSIRGCHDIQVDVRHGVAVASCLGDAQIWDISDPANPTAGDGEPHTHIVSPSATDTFEFIHNAVITYDGAYFAISDETGGGSGVHCDGSAVEEGGQSHQGFYYFYRLVSPGSAAPPLQSRYMIPRAQGAELCEAHNGATVPVKGRYLMTSGFYQGGNTLVDFTDPTNPTEVAYSDLSDGTGAADTWSAYWYNDLVFANGGLDRRGATGNRGVDIFSVQQPGGQPLTSPTQHHLNPQTVDSRPARPAVFRPSSGTWFFRGGAPEAQSWGTADDIPVPADYDDDGYDDVAVFRPAHGVWHLGGATPRAVAWGISGDIPVPADYDGDGDDEVAVFRPASGTWFVQGGPTAAFGASGDIPVPADYDGDGDDDIAVFRPSSGAWFVQNGITASFGTDGDIPVPADYDGDGDDDIAVFRPSGGVWFVANGSPAALAWGTNGDIPTPVDYDGDGDHDVAVFRPGQSYWLVQGGSPAAVAWGTQGDSALRAVRP